MRLSAIFIRLLLLAPTGAVATNGYFAHGYSLAQKAMGGAGTALAEDALAVTMNPAALVFVGERLEASLSLFGPRRDYHSSEVGSGAEGGIVKVSPNRKRSHNEYFPIPAIGYAAPLGPRASWGLAMYGNGGMNTEYQRNSAVFAESQPGLETECAGTFGGGAPTASSPNTLGFCGQGASRAGVDMAQLFVAPSLSLRLGEQSAVGVAALAAANRFAVQGLSAFRQFSNDPANVSDNGYDWSFGVGYRVGLLSQAIPGLALGLSYQPRISMSHFGRYKGLFSEQGDFDIPATVNAGVAIALGSQQTLLIDHQTIWYSTIRSVGNPMDPNRFVNDCAIPRLFGDDAKSPACLGARTGPGFGWDDMRVLKFGYQYEFGGHKLRLGYSTTRQPIRSTEHLFNILAPAVVEQHFTAGLEWRWSEGLRIGMALAYAASNPITGKNPLSNTDANGLALVGAGSGAGGPLGGVLGTLTGEDQAGFDTSGSFGEDENDQDITLNMRQYEFSLGLSWLF